MFGIYAFAQHELSSSPRSTSRFTHNRRKGSNSGGVEKP
jgi:hypothetical protein